MIEELLATQGLVDTLRFGCLVFFDDRQLGGLYVLIVSPSRVAVAIQGSLHIARIVKSTAKKDLIACVICDIAELGD